MNLSSKIENHLRLTEHQKRALKKLGIETFKNLLYHFPLHYSAAAQIKKVASLQKGDTAVVFGRVSKLKTSRAFIKKIPMAEGELRDDTGRIKIVWFNQPYLANMTPEESLVRLEGRVSEQRGKTGGLFFSNPKMEIIAQIPTGAGESLFGKTGESPHLYPVYPESRGITSNWFYHAVRKILKSGVLEELEDPIPEYILKKYNLPSLKTALIWIHAPKRKNDALSARKRFAFEEVFFIQLDRQKTRREYEANPSYKIELRREEMEKFTARFPWRPTSAQTRAVEAVIADLGKGTPAMRLLEGDVGSGKTFVAAATAYAVVSSRPPPPRQPAAGSNPPEERPSPAHLQVAYMCPTEILAVQQFENFIAFFAHLPINIGLITSSGCRKFPSKVTNWVREKHGLTAEGRMWTDISKSQLLKWVANGEISILVGTHALIQKDVRFKHLAYVIIDEQHRFGINQRQTLARGKYVEQTLNYPEEKTGGADLLYKDLIYRVRAALLKVEMDLRGGREEITYQQALAAELEKAKLPFKRGVRIPIIYNKKQAGLYQPDFVIEDKIVVKLKALPLVGNIEKKQLGTYLKNTGYRLALLANFGPTGLTIHRVAGGKTNDRSSPITPMPPADKRSRAFVPHLLSMTATPIPRTLALTIFGDLDLTLLDEMPPGRKPIITEIIPPNERAATYEKIRGELAAGRQAYVICPRIEEPDPTKALALQAKSVKEEADRLKKTIFPEYEVGILHGKLKPAEKEKTMEEFKDGKIKILVATSVVEVGVNVPNATVIVIEGAERFGLAQLHQLRGRVLRSAHQAYCFVFFNVKGKAARERLQSLKKAKNGFELAEFDLKFRGPGELSGSRQWGISDVGMEALKNPKMVEAARKEARDIIQKDESLSGFSAAKKELELRTRGGIHLE